MIGIHIKNINDILVRFNNIKSSDKIKIVQVFGEDVVNKNINKYIHNNNIKIIVHSAYTINLSRDWIPQNWWVNQLINEIRMCHNLSGRYVVVHVGKYMDLEINRAINNMYSLLLHIHRETIDCSDVKILIETPAGQGTELCYKIEEFAFLVNKFKKSINDKVKNRFGICLDTCHIFAAGHNIGNEKQINIFFNKWDKLIGINNINLVHLNDSMYGCGERKDRHETLGKGKIGIKNIIKLIKFFNKLEIPMVLETPINNIENDIKLILNNL